MDEHIEDNLQNELDALDALESGTEEKERQSQVVLNLATAKANIKKAENEIEAKKIDKKGMIIGASITGGLALLGVIVKEILKFIINSRIVVGEKEDYEVYNSAALNNKN